MKTTSWQHQQDAFDRFKDAPVFALFFDPRCGKSHTVLKIICERRAQGLIDRVLVLAPNNVHTNWAKDQLPTHLDIPHTSFIWSSQKSDRVWYKQAFAEFLKSPFPFLCMNCEAITTDNAKAAMKAFLTKGNRPALPFIVFDESDVFQEPDAKRSKVAKFTAKMAQHKAILTGTPATESPFNLYAQFNLLDPDIIGYSSYVQFKTRYARMETGEDAAHREARIRYHMQALAEGKSEEEAEKYADIKAARVGRTWPEVAEYCNLKELQSKIAPYMMRVERKDVSDAPDKIYKKLFFEMTPKQTKLYNDLREKFIVELEEGEITAANVLTRYIRLQQISSNVCVLDQHADICAVCGGDGEVECLACGGLGMTVAPRQVVRADPDHNPRLEAMMTEVAQAPGPAIVWCRFDQDVEDVLQALKLAGRLPVRFDGKTSEEDREKNKRLYLAGDATDFVGKPTSGGRGLDLSRTETVYQYSHYFSLRVRIQGEDRGEGVMKTFATTICDIIGNNTVDEKIIAALRSKKSLSDIIIGDDPREWI